ncbi:hypothetical protein SH580_09125 [Coraliomargarita algicola]|uniref:Uncharacterized protein n=1 Tax=Coraliomargarita algicola TaxID=3092156 RepID=A0ABZ0RNR7_9BACT|nr:hypothetical protein [Coraliomargarita sp. J2-16]WPJ97871.1 hypothetical protein SH580_09125 [Coraliomargarita sp. J2-16]
MSTDEYKALKHSLLPSIESGFNHSSLDVERSLPFRQFEQPIVHLIGGDDTVPGAYKQAGLKNCSFSVIFKQVLQLIENPCVFAIAAGVMLQDIKKEVIKPTGAPGKDQQQAHGFPVHTFKQQTCTRE